MEKFLKLCKSMKYWDTLKFDYVDTFLTQIINDQKRKRLHK